MKTIHHLLAGTGMVLISSAFFGSTATVPAFAQAIERQISAGKQCRLCPPLTNGEGHPTGTASRDTIAGSGSVGDHGTGSVGGTGSISGSGSIDGSGTGSIGGTGSIDGSGSVSSSVGGSGSVAR
ncbi:hypothetical protein [Mesorhizobium delmotii]|uniref:hypothetical protein n=1 Tax=Mesorhizobium delmotii TaxID=1631247 RepID=UPI00140307B6|nr:hypothetical protein [Mesorhizobium delmotii]